MPQQLLLEGTDLEALMLRAREEYGPEVRVVRAEKVRAGGVFGFFTREKFELTLEISDAVAAAALASGPPPVSGAARPALLTRDTETDAQLAEEIADAKAAREAMLADTAVPQPERASEPTDMAQFDELVLQLTDQAATARATALSKPSKAVATRPREVAPATFPGIDRSATVVLSSGMGPAPTSAPPGPLRTGGDAPGAAAGAGAGAGAGADATNADAADADAAAADAEGAPDLTYARRDGVVVNRWGVFTDVATAVATECTAPALLALGVPTRFVQGFDDLDTPVPLLEVVARFGTPPVRRPDSGDVLLVAGPPDKALAVALQVAAWVGVPARAVMLAGEIEAVRGHGRRIRTEDQARIVRRRADEAARLGDPTIVALGVAPGRRGAAAAASLFAAIEADTTWAVVDATKRATTYAGELKLLGAERKVDALAAVGVADAQAPGAILDAPIPAAWMDGLPATGIVWAALLGERIAARE